MKNIYIDLSIITIATFFILSCNHNMDSSSVQTLSPGEMFNSRENIQKYIEGKTWTYTKGSKGWQRLHFENGKAYYYFQYSPSEKTWGGPTYMLPYVIEEDWADGKMYYRITCYQDDIAVLCFIPTSGVLGTLLGGEKLDNGDFNWE